MFRASRRLQHKQQIVEGTPWLLLMNSEAGRQITPLELVIYLIPLRPQPDRLFTAEALDDLLHFELIRLPGLMLGLGLAQT